MISAALPRRIISIGEAMIELAPTDQPDRFGMGFAGDTLNTAWYLRRALPRDWSVDYLTAVGTDAVSARMLDFLAQTGIGTDHVARLADRTVGLYMIELKNGERSFSYWRGQSAARRLADDPVRLDAALAAAGVIYLSGITLAVLEGAGRENLRAALRKARANGALVAFDPNLRPRLWSDTAMMCRAVMEAAALSDIVLPSHEDEASHFGDEGPAATAARYARAGAGLVVVKNGAGEILTLDAGKPATHAPENVATVVDSTAAGDSFNAGFLAAQFTGADLAGAVRAGARLAAHVIRHRGALCT